MTSSVNDLRAAHPDTPGESLDRVSSRIGEAILDFVRSHVEWKADELRAYVAQVCGATAPASADRILRALRLEGRLDYEVVSRRASLYRRTDPKPSAPVGVNEDGQLTWRLA